MSLKQRHFVSLTVLVLAGLAGCREEGGKSGASGSSVSEGVSTEAQALDAQNCGVGFRGQEVSPRGELLQKATAQTTTCDQDECGLKTLELLAPERLRGESCADLGRRIVEEPIVDAWGARARITCNGQVAQALSKGADGTLGTCDDLSRIISLQGPRYPR